MIRRYAPAYLQRHGAELTPTQRKVLACLAACRTASLGARLYQCEHCGQQVPLYNSCNDRHCPQCQGAQRAQWLDQQREQLLPVEYYQVVFTVPEHLAALARSHPKVFYEQLFRAVQATLLEVAAAPQHWGAQMGGVMVLHTWGQTLQLHPHVHVIVPGGGISPDGQHWRACPRGFFLPVRVLSEVFRGKLMDFLKRQHKAGNLPFTDSLAELAEPDRFAAWLSRCYETDWVVYVEPPRNREPEQALKYLPRYTYRVAISNDRLECIEGGQVTFRYKDYAHDGQWRRMTVTADEFLRRFLQHVLPPRLVRIRSFGFLANCHRKKKLAQIRRLLDADAAPTPPSASRPVQPDKQTVDGATHRCPHCGHANLRPIGQTKRPTLRQLLTYIAPLPLLDSS